MKAVFVLSLLLLVSCKPQLVHERSAQYVKDCELKGGKIGSYSFFVPGCGWPTKDAGKVCTDTKQCEGYCKPPTKDGVVVFSENGTGSCSDIQTDDELPNCAVYIKDGKLAASPCSD